MSTINQSATTAIKFENSKDRDFTKTLNKRVSEYFKSNNLPKHANTEMIFKTIFMFGLYLVPYFAQYTATNLWLFFGLYLLMGLGKAGLGLSVMHDANHGAYSGKPWVNKLLSYTMNVIGGNSMNWKIQHNVFHHTYTNIDTHDEDIRPRFILRFSPNAEHRSFHKFQHIYAWFLYGFMTISWLLYKDFAQFFAYHQSGILKKYVNPLLGWVVLIGSKIFYLAYILIIPMILTDFAWWQVFLGFVLMQYVAGFVLAAIFQPAHVMEMNEFPQVEEDQNVKNNWTIHQFKTTCNFARKNKWLSWYAGGLNYQIEHHLFPTICHVHYRRISEIVKSTAQEFNVPYHTMDSFREALVMHGRMLYKLGNTA